MDIIHKIGSSVSFNIFEDISKKDAVELCSAFGGKDEALSYLAQNVEYLELRTVRAHSMPEDVLGAVNTLNELGIKFTIHGVLDELDAFLYPYSMLPNNISEKYNITVHPKSSHEETTRLLRAICDTIEERALPYYITLENQRMKPGTEFGVCEDVASVVEEINSPHLGLCFDFGHQLSNTYKGYTDIVTDRFIKRVKHTHIHGYYEGTTHYPVDSGETLFEKNIGELLDAGYTGVFNLELAPDRYCDKFDVRSSYENSISILKTAINTVADKKKSIEFYEKEYKDALKDLKSRFDLAEDCLCLVGPSAYLLKLGDAKIAVDIAPCILPVSNEAVHYLSDWVNEFDAIVVTHSHKDHCDVDFLNSISDSLPKFIPDFIELDLPNTTKIKNGDEQNVRALKFKFFESAHSVGENVLKEYGFAIEYKNKHYVFPIDVRDYSYEYPKFENVQVLFAHLWLGKGNALNCDYKPYSDDFCQYISQFNAKECYLAHLNDVHRKIEDMWSSTHFDMIRKRLPNIKMFKVGDLIKL